jgi:hypothetical protein
MGDDIWLVSFMDLWWAWVDLNHQPRPISIAVIGSRARNLRLPPFCEAAEGNGGSEQGLGYNYTIRTAGHGFGPQAPSYKELSACLFDFSGGQLPVGSDEVARITVRIALQIVLVLGLGFPEVPDGPHFCDNLSRPEARRVHISNSFFRDVLLLLARVKDGGTVARI